MLTKTQVSKQVEKIQKSLKGKGLSDWKNFPIETLTLKQKMTVTELGETLQVPVWLSNDEDDSVVEEVVLEYSSYDGQLIMNVPQYPDSYLEVPLPDNDDYELWTVWETWVKLNSI